MAYRQYQMPGLIIGSRITGEANRLYQIFTPDFGLVRVLGQSVRLEKSKLRYQLSNYYLADFTMVRGREFWRLTGVDNIWRPADKIKNDFLPFAKKIILILERLVQGEGISHDIFDDLARTWKMFTPNLSLDLEIFLLVRILFNLGYLAKNEATEKIISLTDWSEAKILDLTRNKIPLIKLINSSLAETGL